MRHGDLSNDVPRRLIVDLDYFATLNVTTAVKANRALGRYKSVADRYDINFGVIAELLRKSVQLGLMMELAVIDVEQDEAEAIEEMLDRRYPAHPFAHADAYPSHLALREVVPYRPEVIGVLTPRAGYYGSYFFNPGLAV